MDITHQETMKVFLNEQQGHKLKKEGKIDWLLMKNVYIFILDVVKKRHKEIVEKQI